MRYHVPYRWGLVAAGVSIMGLLSAIPGKAQAISGQARAVQANIAGVSTTLADTGTLGGETDAREASQNAGSIPSVLDARALHATTIGWSDQAASEASLADLAFSVAGVTIGADFVMVRVHSAGGADTITATVEGLAVDGVPVAVTGAKNQRVNIPGGVMLVNEQRKQSSATVVNALHVIIDGVADVIIASATAAR